MAFKLGNKSPLRQEKDPMDQFKPGSQKKNIQISLNESNKTVSNAKANKKQIDIGSKVSQDWDRQGAVAKAVVQLGDPTGVTSYPDVKKAWNDNKTTFNDVTEPLGALPIIGRIPKLFKLAKSMSAVTRVARAGAEINKVTSKVNRASKLVNEWKVTDAAIGSPLYKQKLSPKATKDKAARDLAYAKTPDRRAKKADDQRRHRKDPAGKGKDWDHEDGRWESAAQNRGNDGNGTKSEKGKNYKINKKS